MDSAAAARPDDEEARRRRSTDCIYFLASPLTCKKGTECDYRHSDAARMNPRDCWYWFNGNCANPKCSFRHPPLDSLLGEPTTPRAPQQPAPQVSVPPQPHAGSVPTKQSVPCYYFQKGMCAKGDRCAFSHGPQSAGNPAPQPATAAKVFTPALQPNPQSKNSWTKSNSSAQQKTPAVIPDKSKVSTSHDAKPVQKQHLTGRVDHSSRIYQNHSNYSHVQSGTTKHYHPQPSVQDDLSENGMEAGEFVREPSAGSGVLVGGVDDVSQQPFKGNHSSYHQRTKGTGITRQTHGGYEPERSYRSSAPEKLSSDKRISRREPMPSVAAGSSDLRHRLLKQRRLNNNSRSIEAPDTNGAYLEGERNDQNRRRGEEHDGLSRSRLRDRIRLPGETSFDRLGSRSEKEWDRGRLSPPKHLDLRGKLHERLKARSAEEIPGNSAKSLVVTASSGEDAGSVNFAGPKSLAELKAKKGAGSSSGEDVIVRGVGSSRMTSAIVSSREPAPFEGPKPLSAILKRKREVASENAAAHSGSIHEDDDAAGVDEEYHNLVNGMVGENMEGNGDEEEGEEGAFHPEDDVAYDDDADEAAGQELEEHQDNYDYETADVNAAAGQELEEHQNVEAAAGDYDYEATDINDAAGRELEEHHDGEAAAEEDYDYEATDINDAAGREVEEHQDGEAAAEEDYDYEATDVNAEEDNEYQDDDDDMEEDDDDFARKVGVMIS